MTKIKDLLKWMQVLAPLQLSESWDNTGLLLGDQESKVIKIQTCLTLEPRSVTEAVERKADLVIAHHPLPFKPLAKITTDTVPGKLIWTLATNGIAVYAPHTAWDSALNGINARLARRLGLVDCQPLIPLQDSEQLPESPSLGAGRVGKLAEPQTLEQLVQQLKERVPYCRIRAVESVRPISKVAIACGSGGSFLSTAIRAGCDVLVTGEATYHTCLEAEATKVSLLMLGHYASERFAMEELAQQLGKEFADLEVWASAEERDPVRDF